MAHPSSYLASVPTSGTNTLSSLSDSSLPSGSPMLYVDNTNGNDGSPGTVTQPLRTITKALHQAHPGTLIAINSGDYSSQSGEQFPLVVDRGVMLSGADDGSVLIVGGGSFTSMRRGQQTVTVVVNNDSTLRGLTITNPRPKGTGVWVENGQPTISQCRLRQCQREGMVISASGQPIVSQCQFEANRISGLLCLGESSGIVEHNSFTQAEYGIAIGDRATPHLLHNTLQHNRTGLTIAAESHPKLRGNIIRHNHNRGLVLLNDAQPDLGTETEPGQNIITANSPEAGALGFPSSTQPTATTSTTSPSLSANIQHPTSNIPPSPALFPDLSNHWAQSFIESLHQHTIIQGFPDGTFRPELSLTRAQYAALLHKMFSLPPFVLPNINPERPFRDVSSQFWAAEAIQHASRMGFIAGFPDGTFRPEEALSRAQAIVSLVNGLQLAGGDRTDLERYGDRAQIPNYAKDEIATATHKQLIVNHPDPAQLAPRQPISRAEIATMLYQVRVITGQSVAIASPYIIQPITFSVSFDDVPQPSASEPEPEPESESDSPSTDKGHWAAAFIYGLANQGLISGSSPNTFAPERAVSRAEFAALLTKIFNPLAQQNIPLDQTFIDVPKRFWGHDVIQRVVQAGLMSGFDDGSFQPHQDVMRWQVFLSVTQALGLLPETGDTYEVQASQRLHHFYTDVDSIPALARGAIATATTQNLVVNHPIPNRLNASRGATRAEVAAILYQSLTTTHRLPPLSSPYIFSPTSPAPSAPPVPPAPPTSPTPPTSPAPPSLPAPPIFPAPLLLPTALLSPVQPNYTLQDLETYLFGYTNQSNLMIEAVAAQLRQQSIHVVLHSPQNKRSMPSEELAMIPSDSEMMIRLQVSDQPDPQTTAYDVAPPNIENVAWSFTILFEARSPQGLDLAQRLHSAILSRTGLADGGIQSTTTLWPDAASGSALASPSLTAITPDASVLIRLSPVMALTEDYPPIPTTPMVWAIASTTVERISI